MSERKLLRHFKAMQKQAQDFIVPGHYNSLDGKEAVTSDAQLTLFINDMLYMLDGPEQREAQEAAAFDFEAECLRTASNTFRGELVPLSALTGALHRFISAAEELDVIKKLLFYGEDKAKGRVSLVQTEDLGRPNCFQAISNIVNEDEDGPWIGREEAELLLHGVIGGATEKGELAEALYNVLTDEKPDAVNFKEEVFDGQWYDALVCKALRITFDEGQRNIIAKLRKRFPDKFTEDAANNRDLGAERKVLEAQPIGKLELLPVGSIDPGTYTVIVNEDGTNSVTKHPAPSKIVSLQAVPDKAEAALADADKEMLKQRLLQHFSETDAAIEMEDRDAALFCDADTVARRTMSDSGRGWYVKADFPTALFTTARCAVCGQQVQYGHADKCPNKNRE